MFDVTDPVNPTYTYTELPLAAKDAYLGGDARPTGISRYGNLL